MLKNTGSIDLRKESIEGLIHQNRAQGQAAYITNLCAASSVLQFDLPQKDHRLLDWDMETFPDIRVAPYYQSRQGLFFFSLKDILMFPAYGRNA